MQLPKSFIKIIFVTSIIILSNSVLASDVKDYFKMAGAGKIKLSHYEEIELNDCHLKAIAFQQMSETKVNLYCENNIFNISEGFLSSFKDLKSFLIKDESVILVTLNIGAHSERAILVNPLSSKVYVDLKSDWPIGFELEENKIKFYFDQDGQKKQLMWPR